MIERTSSLLQWRHVVCGGSGGQGRTLGLLFVLSLVALCWTLASTMRRGGPARAVLAAGGRENTTSPMFNKVQLPLNGWLTDCCARDKRRHSAQTQDTEQELTLARCTSAISP